MAKDLMTIGELAKLMGVTVRTLQYYDRENLLTPSAFSDGGRRLYSSKDLVKLHQILSFKYLGFSLEEIKNHILPLSTPEEVAQILVYQRKVIEERIENLQEALDAVDALHAEVMNINQVDFKKYAEIIELLRAGNTNYWVWKLFDDTLTEHVKDRFANSPETAQKLMETYLSLLDQTLLLKEQQEPIDSEQGFKLAEKWWSMITDFTGGNMELMTNLMKFNDNKSNWNEEISEKQQEIDTYLDSILSNYFSVIGFNIQERE